MISIRSIFRRLPSVTYSRGKYHVHGSAADVIRMCAACGMALERRGVDTSEVRHALSGVAKKYIAWMAEEAEKG